MRFRVSVRELVSFVHRTGDLGGDGLFRPQDRAVEGTRGHQRLQQARGEGYEAEVPLEAAFTRDDLTLELLGRVDGISEEGPLPLVEEIKTVDSRWNGHPHALHRAQLRLYGALLARERGWRKLRLRLTYLHFQNDEETPFEEVEQADALEAFLEETLEPWFEWLGRQAQWKATRNASLERLPFPFGGFREGQRALSRLVYRAIRDGGNAFVEAPTGLGKTMATLFPAIRALPLQREGQVFYVTAKTPGRRSAREAIEHLRNAGARLRCLLLTAKERICFGPQPCDVRACPYALGYYDRHKPAVRELLEKELIEQPAIEEVARRHQVCPFELALDASLWTDVVVGDFNHVFDPVARLARHFADGPRRHVVLVDEAHNLVDRSRDMFSAELKVEDLRPPARDRLKTREAVFAARALEQAQAALTTFLAEPVDSPALPPRPHHDGALAMVEMPGELIGQMRYAARSLEIFLAEQPPGTDLTGWLDPWYALIGLLRAADGYDTTCRTLIAPDANQIRLFCLDPSGRLRIALKGLRAAIFFSATLSPMGYFNDLLGGGPEDTMAQFASPFAPDQMRLSISALDVTYKGRTSSLPEVARQVGAHIAMHPGNHLVFCPSLAYLASLEGELVSLLPGDVTLFTQGSMMNETERKAFLDRFEPGQASVGLAVLGGIFSEGIDLPGERLIAVTVIGVGLPRLSLERDLLLEYFDARHGAGFDYAYRFPGMQRVLQAVGRLIRSEKDRGSTLLVDYRFNEWRYRLLFPEWWQVQGRGP